MHLNGSRVFSSTEDVRRKGCLSEQSRRNCEGKVRRNNFKQLENAFATTIEEEPEDKTESEQLESVSEKRKEIEDEEKKDVDKVGPATTSSVAVEDEDVELRRKKEKAAQQQQGGKGLFALGKETFGKIRRSMTFSSGSSLWPKSQPKTIETQGSPKPSRSPEPTKSPKLSRSPDKQKGPHHNYHLDPIVRLLSCAILHCRITMIVMI